MRAWILLLLVFAAVHAAALFTPPLLDDADATHATAAQYMARSGDWVTLKVDGVRYLEKPPLPYWLAAADYRLFGYNVFATHLPLTLGVLGLAILAWIWGRRAYGERAAFYAALSILTSAGVFLFTRIFIPEVLLTLLLAFALYNFLIGLEDEKPSRFYLTWAALALAMLAKGLVAPVFFFLAAALYLLLTREWRRWREFRIPSGLLLFLAIAAPWHILAGLRNPGAGHPIGNIPTPGSVHGFFYFYFINEQVLRFLGKRYPVDYNKLPFVLYWSLHLVWLFPWSIYLPVVLRRAWSARTRWNFVSARATLFRARTTWLLAIYAAVILVFFSLSTNQEYYTFPVYFPLLVLTAGSLASEETEGVSKWLNGAQVALALIGLVAAGRAWLRTVVVSPPSLGQRHWRASRASGCRRIYPLDVSFIRPHRAFVCCVASACGIGCSRFPAGPRDRLAAASPEAPFRGHGQCRFHLCCISHRRAYCPGALRAHALLARHG